MSEHDEGDYGVISDGDDEAGLRPFRHESLCLKCAFTGIRVVYHFTIVVSLGHGQSPCAAWLLAEVLPPDTGPHLCMQCLRCGYGWVTKTADAAPVEGLE